MTQEHPITPPPELVQQWWDGTHGAFYEFEAVATQAARWGADQELEACCEFDATVYSTDCADKLRRHRRPKPPSLKEQALFAIDTAVAYGRLSSDVSNVVRRALESLPD